MKTAIPNQPFTTKDFSLRGGGIDFLGLRWVNLTIVGQYLIPELNNVTQDMGTYFLAAWIPWKFRELCTSPQDYTEKNYQAFREKVEVGIALSYKEEEGPYGAVRNRVGNDQACDLPSILTFSAANRSDDNSLYAAAIYGPSIQYLGFIASYRSQAAGGLASLKIPVLSEESQILQVVRGVDESLRRADCYVRFASLSPLTATQEQIRELSAAGLNPARFRSAEFSELKRIFAKQLLPASANAAGYARTLTAKLVLQTLKQKSGISTDEIRNIWYTGMAPDGAPLRFEDPEIEQHRIRWAHFMARQYQRYALELFLWCFEVALKAGCKTIDEVVAHWLNEGSLSDSRPFRGILNDTAEGLLAEDDLLTSEQWNRFVPSEHRQFEFVRKPQGDEAALHGLQMFAGWYWRMLWRRNVAQEKEFLTLGGSDRLSIAWFLDWLGARVDTPVREMLRDLFSDLIFAQHLRVALSRFDGKAQRLRFLLEDHGIEPTVSARQKMGQTVLPWMPDRLDALTNLLSDCDVLENRNGVLYEGPGAKAALGL